MQNILEDGKYNLVVMLAMDGLLEATVDS